MNNRRKTRRFATAAALTLLVAAPAAACSSDDESSSDTEAAAGAEVAISDAWARSGAAGGNTAVYMVLQGGSQADDLVGASVSSDVAAEAQVHETTADDGMTDDSMAGDEGDMSADEGMSDDSMTDDSMTDEGMSEDDMGGGSGMMTMQEVEEVPVPADGSVALEPGGYHIMLLDLAADLTAGDTVEVTLLFSSGAEETIDAEVRDS